MPHPGASYQFCWPCPTPQQNFCTILVVYHTLPVFGGPLAGSEGGREPRGRRSRCAGACSRNFWLARAKGACSPPGQRPNGMAGWLPAFALIAASLRFEVTRSFQSFISTLIRACNNTGPGAAPPPLAARAPLCREKLFCFARSQDSSSPWQNIPTEQLQMAGGDVPAFGEHLHPRGPLLFLKMSLRGPETSSHTSRGKKNTPRGKEYTPRPACRGLVRRHSPLQNNLELPSFPAKALGRVFYSRSL